MAAVARRFKCSNCSAKRRGRKPAVTVEVVRQYRTASELARGEIGNPNAPANDP
ncbi:hypothetical protein U91I_01191 [alpha proteobacterium U9-1i]|nr:hypothetical protein U91I_01191 [alpha proteobacterium U9-1i]